MGPARSDNRIVMREGPFSQGNRCMKDRFRSATGIGPIEWASIGLALVVLSCGGPGNTGRWTPDPNLVKEVPWLNGVLPALDSGREAILAQTPSYPAVASGQPDLGSQHLDCSGLAGLEFSTSWFESFESDMPNDPTHIGVGSGWAGYDDLTKYAFHVPGDVTWYPELVSQGAFSAPWGMPADNSIPGPSCDGMPNHWALHFRGGLFRKWGGGMSHAFTDPVGRYRDDVFSDCPPGVDFCPPKLPDGAKIDSAGLPTVPANAPTHQQSHEFVHASPTGGTSD